MYELQLEGPRAVRRMPANEIRPGGRSRGTNSVHSYPVVPTGETIASLYRTGTQQELEEALGAWLRATISRLEGEKEKKAAPANQSH